jgi:hypothetical protein
MKRALSVLLLAGAVAHAEPIEGLYEVAKVDDKPAADVLKTAETVWARYLLAYRAGKVSARVEVIHKTKDADRFVACSATVTVGVVWKGDSYTVADEATAESGFMTLVRGKEGDRTKVSAEQKTCTVNLPKGTYKAAKTKDGAKLTLDAGGVFTLVPAEGQPKYADILGKI